MLLYEKYAPSSISDLLTSNLVKLKLKEFADSASQGKKTAPLLIYGPSGTGKTAAVHAIASSYNLKLIEFNASDYRDAETLRKKLLPATATRNLFNEKLLILFDEVDELSSRFDSGAEPIILKVVKGSKQPVVLIANDYWDKKITFLRNQTDKIEFKRIGTTEMVRYLSFVAHKEDEKMNPEVVKEIAARSNGDIRGALNDLDALLGASPELIEHIGVRNRKSEIFRLLDKIFLTGSFDAARAAMLNSDISLDMLINWIDQNIPAKYLSKKGINAAYEQLSRASMFLEKASRDNYYEYLRYASVIMSAGVSVSGGGSVSTLTPYSFPAKITYMSRTKKDRNAMNEIAMKLSNTVHTSRKQIISGYLPLLKKMVAAYGPIDSDEAKSIVRLGTGMEIEDLETVLDYYRMQQ